ncbi:type II toxin-antitoxin system RelE/ParE family toxin [Alicyclobacillus sp. SP_1]|uniref:type II toxin-antitoxin system RelE family toxin n=1 Tax=Alicyclobacillus sp. SP_1 TaxID=2942475 RepID=UPI002157CE12|nr:type II toxin-antitoxin system RelE/ParE family toxin [Alicyclobacillus sp. SP_1]
MTYDIRLTKKADKDFSSLDRVEMKKAAQALAKLKTDPYAGHTLSSKLNGVRSLEFSAPGGAYRAAYVVREELNRCVVFMVGSHENFYQEAERRYEALKQSGQA